MTDDELKIQLALGTLKWYQLSKDVIDNIDDIELINMLYQQITKDQPSMFELLQAECSRVDIYNRHRILTTRSR